MKRNLFIAILLFPLLFACAERNTVSVSHLSDLMDIDAIEQVKMSNNSGTFYLSPEQLVSFKKDLHKLSYVPGSGAKVGAISMDLTIKGKKYGLSSSTHGQYVEAHSSIATKNQDQLIPDSWLYFETNGVNFDNYKKL